LGRAARTDAGVHAAGNVVSIKMITSLPGVPDVVARINEELPPEIRLWGYVGPFTCIWPEIPSYVGTIRQVRVQNSFNARLFVFGQGAIYVLTKRHFPRLCDSRKYTYLFPTYLLIPPKPGSGLDRNLRQHAASLSPISPAPDSSPHPFWMVTTDRESSTRDDDLLRKRSWRVSPGQLAKLRETVQRFEGTHNFHNFTVGRDFSDRSNQRHMKKIEVSLSYVATSSSRLLLHVFQIGDPAVYGETEWISVLFHGQSFMLHQVPLPKISLAFDLILVTL
jgi:tRNA pseudouridine38-40 synthase